MPNIRLSPELQADCTRCCALCCVGPGFDADQGFGFDKPACTPCTNLGANFRCAVHAERRQRGFTACITFDCYGAGQRVTRHFGGRSWQSSPELAAQMFHAYSRYRILHELMALLELAIQTLMPREAVRLRELHRSVDELCESGMAMSRTVRIDDLKKDVLSCVREALKTHVPIPEQTTNNAREHLDRYHFRPPEDNSTRLTPSPAPRSPLASLRALSQDRDTE